MKTLLLPMLLLMAGTAYTQEDYTLHVDGKTLKVSLDKKYEVVINGKKVSLFITANDTLTYDDEYVHFLYPKGFSISGTKVEEGIEQVTIINAEGSGVLIQSYSSFDPSMLNELMLSEITKESISYGYKLKREDYKLVIGDGKEIEVKKAVLTYKDEINVYEIASHGKKDEGALVITMRMNSDKNSQGQKLIELMWKTLKFK